MAGTARSKYPALTLVVLVAVAIGAVLRLAFLRTDSFWLDEAFSVNVATQSSAVHLWSDRPDPLHPSLFYVILRASLQWAGVSEAAARLPSAVASLLNLGLTYVLARRLRLTGRMAAGAVVLLALSPIDIWYAREARMYEVVATAGLITAIGLTIDSWAGALMVTTGVAAGLYLDFSFAPLCAVLLGLAAVRSWHVTGSPMSLVRMALSMAVGVWLSRPLWPQMALVVTQLDLVTFFAKIRRLTGGHVTGATVAIALCLGAIGSAAAGELIWRVRRHERLQMWFAWALSVGIMAATVALTLPRAYSAKQILVTGWPLLMLGVAWTLAESPDADGVRPRLRLGAVVGVSFIAAVVSVTVHRADWRGAVAYLNREASVGATVWVDPSWDHIPYDYYRPAHAATTPASGAWAMAPGVDLWLVAERYGTPAPTSPTEAWLDRHAQLVAAVPVNRLQLREYRLVR